MGRKTGEDSIEIYIRRIDYRLIGLLSSASEHLVIEEWDSGYKITVRLKTNPPPVMLPMTGSVEELEG